MKRLLLLLRGNTAEFSGADEPWTTLHKKLADECTGEDARQGRLTLILDWAEKNRIRDRRHDVVHAYWWNLDGCGVVRSRFYHHEDGVMITGSFEDLEEDADLLFEFARRLDELLGEDWPRAMLPPGEPA